MRLAHLETIQSIIRRMAAASGAIKGFCITLSGAILALRPSQTILVAVFILFFALLDAGYLGIERDFKETYNRVAGRPLSEAEDLRIVRSRNRVGGFIGALFSWSVLGFYLCLIAATVAIAVTNVVKP